MARNGKKKTQKPKSLPYTYIEPDAAGIDIGATEIYVAVPEQRDNRPVRKYATFTEDLHVLADWPWPVQSRRSPWNRREFTGSPFSKSWRAGVWKFAWSTPAMSKGCRGAKPTSRIQWLQYLHSVGLLRGSFRPGQAICAVRSVLRHRDTLLKSASRQVLLMQKALTQMNLQLHNVISDITGLSGLAIIDAILMGEREPSKLSRLMPRTH